MLPKLVLAAAIVSLLVAGCGEESGVESGAAVTAYVAMPLCGEAKLELARAGGRAGEVEVRVVCLAGTGSPGELDLAAIGAGARRATEDSTSVGYIEPPGPATRFSAPIFDAAGIARIQAGTGSAGMSRLLTAIQDADPDSLRESVTSAIDGS